LLPFSRFTAGFGGRDYRQGNRKPQPQAGFAPPIPAGYGGAGYGYNNYGGSYGGSYTAPAAGGGQDWWSG
jgi:hypothetical protein